VAEVIFFPRWLTFEHNVEKDDIENYLISTDELFFGSCPSISYPDRQKKDPQLVLMMKHFSLRVPHNHIIYAVTAV
jgi:hypothetical protein